MPGGAPVHAARHGGASGTPFSAPYGPECFGGQPCVLCASAVERDAAGGGAAAAGAGGGGLRLFGGLHGVLRRLHKGRA